MKSSLTPKDLLTKLKSSTMQHWEILNCEQVVNQLEIKGKLRIYAGFEASGLAHIGHLPVISLLANFAKYTNCQVYLLVSSIHGKLNNKADYEQELKKQFQGYLKNTKIIFVWVSDYRDFQTSPSQWYNYLRLVETTTLRRACRGLDTTGKLKDPLTNKLSALTYPLLQGTDMLSLDIDLAIAGIDQRKIHMLNHEMFNKLKIPKKGFIHLKSLLVNPLTGVKFSKSKGDLALGLDHNMYSTYLDKFTSIQLSTLMDNLALYFNIQNKQDLINLLVQLDPCMV